MIIHSSPKRSVRILILGGRGVGKTSLILSLVSEEFLEDVPPKAEEITIPAEITPELVPTNIVDYSALELSEDQLQDELHRAHVVCLVYSVIDEDSLAAITNYWIPLIRGTLPLVKMPIVLVGNKADLINYSTTDAALNIMSTYPEVESFIECSAKTLHNISEMFYYAQKAVLHPMAPIYMPEKQDLTDECKEALARIFKICDLDNNGVLDDHELNVFQCRCFESPLRPEALNDVKAILGKNIKGGLNEDDFITLKGFQFLHCLFMQRGRSHTVWAVLRKFGYTNDLHLSKDILYPCLNVPVGCSVELTHKGQQFLSNLFDKYDRDNDAALSPAELNSLLSVCPEPPWTGELRNMVCTNQQGWLNQHGWLCYWTLTTMFDVETTLEYLAYFGYLYHHDRETQLTAVQVTREKKLDLLKKQSTRNVYVCHVIGAKSAGKTELCRSHIGVTSAENGTNPHLAQAEPQYTINTVQVYGQEKFLILKDIDITNVREPLSPSDVNCDVACLVYDVSNSRSFEYIAKVYLKYFVGSHVPVMIVSNKSDLTAVSQDYICQPNLFCDNNRLPQPHDFSSRKGSQKELFIKLATMAAFPDLYNFNIMQTDLYNWKAGIGVALITLVGVLVLRLLKPDKSIVR